MVATLALGAFQNEALALVGGASSYIIYPVVPTDGDGNTGENPSGHSGIILGPTGRSWSVPYPGGDHLLDPNDTESPMVHITVTIEISNLTIEKGVLGGTGYFGVQDFKGTITSKKIGWYVSATTGQKVENVLSTFTTGFSCKAENPDFYNDWSALQINPTIDADTQSDFDLSMGVQIWATAKENWDINEGIMEGSVAVFTVRAFAMLSEGGCLSGTGAFTQEDEPAPLEPAGNPPPLVKTQTIEATAELYVKPVILNQDEWDAFIDAYNSLI